MTRRSLLNVHFLSFSHQPSPRIMDTNPEETRVLTKRVLWKLDYHILPPLALVRHAISHEASPLAFLIYSNVSFGLRISLTEAMWAMQGNCSSDSRLPNSDLFLAEELLAWKPTCILQAINLTQHLRVRQIIFI